MTRGLKNLDPILHNELRLKIMVTLDSLDDADFVYLKKITGATSGNLSVQITNLENAGYIETLSSGKGRKSHTVCRITPQGTGALLNYQQTLMGYFSHSPETEKQTGNSDAIPASTLSTR